MLITVLLILLVLLHAVALPVPAELVLPILLLHGAALTVATRPQVVFLQQIMHALPSLQQLIQGQIVLRPALRLSQVLPVLLLLQLHSVIVNQAAMNTVVLPSQNPMSHHLTIDPSQVMTTQGQTAVLPHRPVRAEKAIPARHVPRILPGRIRLTARLQGVAIHVLTVLLQEAITAVVVPTALLQEATTLLPEIVA